MNVENMLKVADAIEKRQAGGNPVGFNMNTYISRSDRGYKDRFDAAGNMCGTTACVAGFCSILLDETLPSNKHPNVYFDRGSRYLELDIREATSLFIGAIQDFNEHHPLVPDALRYMAMTGVIDWKEALEAAACSKEKSFK